MIHALVHSITHSIVVTLPVTRCVIITFMFIDEVEISLKAGDGGPGRVSFFPGKHSGPDGGNGGYGGDLYVRASSNLTNLNNFLGKRLISALNGEPGGKHDRFGAKGEDLEVNLPIGTLLIDAEKNEEIELTLEHQRILVCIGGKGGKGNSEFKSPSNTAPSFAQKGLRGQKRNFKILLRMIADFGLIGLPNAGKSSLLNELTNANAEVASYPFTTLQPNLGVLDRKVIADIPGLIEGASEGKGLGVKFLKHIEKVRLLIHCIACDSLDVILDYKTVIKELKSYKAELFKKKQIILLTKSDLVSRKDLAIKIKKLQKFQKVVLSVSIHDWDSLEGLKQAFKKT